MSTLVTPTRLRGVVAVSLRFASLLSLVLLCLLPAQAADSAKAAFDVPADAAEKSLKRFSEQAGCNVLFSSSVTNGTRTRALKGEMTPREALDAMLAGTGLVAVQDRQTGAFSVRKETSGPNAQRVAQTSDRPTDQQAGSIVTGRVQNAATTAFLEGARVEVQGTSNFVLTDRSGYYRISVLAGPQTLLVSYTGLETQSIPVDVAAGATREHDVALTSEFYRLEKFVVVGMREGNALAITQQRQASNVKNVVATDIFGNIADGNVGDFLQRLPGITAEYSSDFDVRSVSVRGLDGGLNAVTMDGERVAASQSAGLGRQFEFEQASLGLIESIEVTKAPTPDMDADSIGGNINMVTKNPFGRSDARYSNYSIGFAHTPTRMQRGSDRWIKEPIKGFGPSLNFTYSDVIGAQRNIGILITATYHAQPSAAGKLSQMQYQRRLSDPVYLWNVRSPSPVGAPRTRVATGARIDYKLSERTTFTLNTAYNWFHEDNDTRHRIMATSQAIATFDANGNRTGSGTIHPNYTNAITEVLPSNSSTSSISMITNDKSGRTYQFQPSARHRFNGVVIDYGLSWSNSATYYDTSPFNRRYSSYAKGTIAMVQRNIGWIVDRSHSLDWPRIVQTSGPDINDLNNYSDLRLTQPERTGHDTITSGRFNFRKDFNLAVPVFFKTGLNYRRQQRSLNFENNYSYRYIGGGGLGQFVEIPDRYRHYYQGQSAIVWPDARRIAQHVQDHPEQWQEDLSYHFTQRLLNDRKIAETVAGMYAMGSVRLQQLTILGGFRVEDTRTDGEGPLQELTAEERARRAAWVGPLTSEEIERRAYAQYGGRMRAKGQYRNIFPGIHLRHETRGGLVSRLSYSNGIARPAFGSIIPLNTANYDNETLTMSNPGLKPQYSDNFDFSLEYYFEPVGLISASLFLKEVSNFIFQDRSRFVGGGPNNGFEGQYEGFNIITTANGGSARYRGFELNYQQQFTFLPGFWSGFGLNMNYTQLETRGDYGGTVSTTEVAGFRPKTANVSLSYAKNKVSAWLLLNWRDDYLNGISTDPSLITYQNAVTTLNIKTKYSFSRRFSVFFDMDNITSRDVVSTYYVFKDRPALVISAKARLVAGIRGAF